MNKDQPDQSSNNKEKIDEKEIDLLDIIIIPLKYIRMIFWVNFIVAVLTVAYYMGSIMLPPEKSYSPNVYTAETKILIPGQQSNSSSLLGNLAGNAALGGLAASMGINLNQGINNTQIMIGLLKSNTIIDSVVEKFILPEISEKKDKNEKISMESLRKSVLSSSEFEISEDGFLLIKNTNVNKEKAQKIVEFFIQRLDEENRRLSISSTKVKRKFIEARIEENSTALKQAQENFIDFQKKTGIIAPDQEANALTGAISDLYKEIIEKESELEIHKKLSKVDDFKRSTLELELEAQRKQLNSLLYGTESSNRVITPKYFVPEKSRDYLDLKRELEIQEILYSTLLNQLEITRIEEKSDAPTIEIVDPPLVPEIKSGPSRGKKVIINCLATMFLTILISYIREYMKNINKDEDTRSKLNKIKSYLSPIRLIKSGK